MNLMRVVSGIVYTLIIIKPRGPIQFENNIKLLEIKNKKQMAHFLFQNGYQCNKKI